MDEINCPECGRPNLIEAEKCWYCQVPLVNKENTEEELSETAAEQTEGTSLIDSSAAEQENEENLPEWLKRIRELKRADTPIEEVDEWQQEKLFPGLTPEPDGPVGRSEPPSKPPREQETHDPKPVIPEGQPMLDDTFVEEEPEEQILTGDSVPKDEEEVADDPEDELPEGFTPLEH